MWGFSDDKILERLSDRGFRKGVSKQALAYAHERWPGKELSTWNVHSGLTFAAQSFEPDARYEIEVMAGELLSV